MGQCVWLVVASQRRAALSPTVTRLSHSRRFSPHDITLLPQRAQSSGAGDGPQDSHLAAPRDTADAPRGGDHDAASAPLPVTSAAAAVARAPVVAAAPPPAVSLPRAAPASAPTLPPVTTQPEHGVDAFAELDFATAASPFSLAFRRSERSAVRPVGAESTRPGQDPRAVAPATTAREQAGADCRDCCS